MRIYFSGIGGVGIGPLAEIALDAGYSVVGSDLVDGLVTKELQKRGIPLHTGPQEGTFLQQQHDLQPIDLFVHTAALPVDHPELLLAQQLGIPTAKRDQLIARIIKEKGLTLIAISGTHGKTTTTGMTVWVMQQLGIPVSYSVGSTLSFGPEGKYDPQSKYFVYEADEYDRNMLHFQPRLSLLPSVDYDHPDTYPTEEEYKEAFRQFISQSDHTILWQETADYLDVDSPDLWQLQSADELTIALTGAQNRRNATLVAKAMDYLKLGDQPAVIEALEHFPGTDRRFERLGENLYSDYGHHPAEIAATLQLAHELSDHVVLVYQPHQNRRQQQVKDDYRDQFELAETVYWLPTYLTRGDSAPILAPEELYANVTNKAAFHTANLNDELWNTIQRARDEGKLVLAMGAGTIDSWLRDQLALMQIAEVLVRDTDGNFILQKRDNIPTISNPGMLTAFGGHAESMDKTIRAAAFRELTEETNLTAQPGDLVYFKTYRKTMATHNEESSVTYFLLNNADISSLKVYEGQGYEAVAPDADLSKFPISPLAQKMIEELRSGN